MVDLAESSLLTLPVPDGLGGLRGGSRNSRGGAAALVLVVPVAASGLGGTVVLGNTAVLANVPEPLVGARDGGPRAVTLGRVVLPAVVAARRGLWVPPLAGATLAGDRLALEGGGVDLEAGTTVTDVLGVGGNAAGTVSIG